MSVLTSELLDYGSANMREVDTGSQGGAIDLTTKIDFTDIASSGTISVSSSDGGDTMDLTVTSRNNAGVIQSEILTLSGGTPVVGSNTVERIMKSVLASPATGIVTIFKTSDSSLIMTMEPGITTVRRPFYNASTPTVGSKSYYEKYFTKNINGTLALTSAQIIKQTDALGKITFALAATLNDTDTSTNRITAPDGLAFDNNAKAVASSGNLTPGDSQGVWLCLTLALTDAAAKNSITMRITGQST